MELRIAPIHAAAILTGISSLVLYENYESITRFSKRIKSQKNKLLQFVKNKKDVEYLKNCSFDDFELVSYHFIEDLSFKEYTT